MFRLTISNVPWLTLVAALVAAGNCEAAERAGGFPWIDPELHGVPVVLYAGSELNAEHRKACIDLAGDKQLKFLGVATRIDANNELLIRPAELPEAIVAVGPLDEQNRERLLTALGEHSACVGIAVEPGAVLLVSEREIRVLGDSGVTFVLAASSGRPLRMIELK